VDERIGSVHFPLYSPLQIIVRAILSVLKVFESFTLGAGNIL